MNWEPSIYLQFQKWFIQSWHYLMYILSGKPQRNHLGMHFLKSIFKSWLICEFVWSGYRVPLRSQAGLKPKIFLPQSLEQLGLWEFITKPAKLRILLVRKLITPSLKCSRQALPILSIWTSSEKLMFPKKCVCSIQLVKFIGVKSFLLMFLHIIQWCCAFHYQY